MLVWGKPGIFANHNAGRSYTQNIHWPLLPNQGNKILTSSEVFLTAWIWCYLSGERNFHLSVKILCEHIQECINMELLFSNLRVRKCPIYKNSIFLIILVWNDLFRVRGFIVRARLYIRSITCIHTSLCGILVSTAVSYFWQQRLRNSASLGL